MLRRPILALSVLALLAPWGAGSATAADGDDPVVPPPASVEFSGSAVTERSWAGWADWPAYELALCQQPCLDDNGRIDPALTGTTDGPAYVTSAKGASGGDFTIEAPPAEDYRVAIAFPSSPGAPHGYLALVEVDAHGLVGFEAADLEEVVVDRSDADYTVRVPRPPKVDRPTARVGGVRISVLVDSYVVMSFRVRNVEPGTRIRVQAFGSCRDGAVATRRTRRTGTFRMSAPNVDTHALGQRFRYVVRATQAGKEPYTWRSSTYSPMPEDRHHHRCR